MTKGKRFACACGRSLFVLRPGLEATCVFCQTEARLSLKDGRYVVTMWLDEAVGDVS
jgi:hypothetical protein